MPQATPVLSHLPCAPRASSTWAENASIPSGRHRFGLLGEEWAAGELTIADEHRASAICERLTAPRAHQPPGRPRGIAVTATPPAERHALPALMAAACLREDRWLVHHLAADLPVADVIGLALDTGADLVVLSSASAQTARAARRAAREIGFSAPHLRVLAGRPGDGLSELLRLARLG